MAQGAASTIAPGSSIDVYFADENDPTGPMEAFYVSGDGDESKTAFIGNSFGAESDEWFAWLIRGCAAFHNLKVNDYTDRLGE